MNTVPITAPHPQVPSGFPLSTTGQIPHVMYRGIMAFSHPSPMVLPTLEAPVVQWRAIVHHLAHRGCNLRHLPLVQRVKGRSRRLFRWLSSGGILASHKGRTSGAIHLLVVCGHLLPSPLVVVQRRRGCPFSVGYLSCSVPPLALRAKGMGRRLFRGLSSSDMSPSIKGGG
jgi:hypothetical protein